MQTCIKKLSHEITCWSDASVVTFPEVSFTFHRDLVLSSVGVSEDLHVNGHLSHGVVHPRA